MLAQKWRYTLKLKDLLASGEGPDFDYDAHALEIAGKMSERIKAFMGKLRMQGDLYCDLDEIVDMFDDISKDVSADADDFNYDMEQLYDVCDRHRVWVE